MAVEVGDARAAGVELRKLQSGGVETATQLTQLPGPPVENPVVAPRVPAPHATLPAAATGSPATRFTRVATGIDVAPFLAELDAAPEMWLFVLGGLFVAVTLFAPRGILGEIPGLWARWREGRGSHG